MDKKIIFTGRNMNWLIFKGRLEYYTINSGRITQGVKTEQLLSNRLLLKEIIQNGFDSYEKNFEGRKKIFGIMERLLTIDKIRNSIFLSLKIL